MIRLLDRYIVRQFTGTFLSLILGLPLLFIIGDVTDNLDDYLAKGLSWGAVVLSYAYYLPQFIFWSLPIAGLVATVFTISSMTRHQEITAAKAGGVSFYRLIAPILAMAAILSLATIELGEMIPLANAKRAAVLGEETFTMGTMRNNFVFQTESGRTLSARALDSNTDQMSSIVVERDRTEQAPGTHITAVLAKWTQQNGWLLKNGYLRLLNPGEQVSTFKFDSLRIPALTETPEDLLADPKEPDEMRYGEMTRFIGTIQRAGGDVRKLRVERAQKITLPLALLVIVVFGAPLSTSSQRGGAAFGIGISLAVTMVYLMLFKVGTAVGASGTLPPLVAAWGPNVLFLVAGVFLLFRVRT